MLMIWIHPCMFWNMSLQKTKFYSDKALIIQKVDLLKEEVDQIDKKAGNGSQMDHDQEAYVCMYFE